MGIVIGLESVGHQHPDFIPFCVLNMYHWMYSATAYNHAYNDSGIFCIHASSHPQSLVELTQVLVRELVAITGRISEEELNRAKTQLKSMLLMNLESRPVIFEDCARQVLAQGHRRKPEHFISQIDMVTRDDLTRRVPCRTNGDSTCSDDEIIFATMQFTIPSPWPIHNTTTNSSWSKLYLLGGFQHGPSWCLNQIYLFQTTNTTS